MRKIITNTVLILNRSERKKGLVLITLNLLVSALDVAFLACLIFVVQLYSGTPAFGHARLPAALTDPTSLLPIGIFFCLFAVKNLFSFWVFRAQCSFRYQVNLRISDHNLLQYLEGSFDDYVHIDSSVHFTQINLQPAEFAQHVMEGLQQSISEWTLIGLTTVAVLLFNAKLFLLLLLLLVPPVIIVARLTRRQIQSARENIERKRGIAWQRLEESINGFIESNLYHRKEFFTGRYHQAQHDLNKHLSALQAMQGAPARLAEVFAVFGLLSLIAINHWAGPGQTTAFVTLGAFLAAAYKIIPGIARILNLNGQIRAYAYTTDTLLKRKYRKPVLQQDVVKTKIGSITFNDIHFRYSPGQHPVLRDFNLHVGSGCFLGIEGDSGKGKSTLLNILLGFLSPEKGDILFNDRTTDLRERKNFWPQIAYVKQQPFILQDTLLTNITLSENAAEDAPLQRVLAASGLDSIVRKTAVGVRTWIAENGKNISGGQRQRIAIARALYKDPDVFLLDEPFSELDEPSEERFLRHFRQLADEGRIVILITHNRKSLSWCNKVISLREEYA